MSFLGKVGSIANKLSGGVGSLVSGAGGLFKGPNTAGLEAEQAEARAQRAKFMQEYDAGRGVQDVIATHSNAAQTGPIERASAAGIQPVDLAVAGQIARTPGAVAADVERGPQVDAAQVGPMAQAQAAQGSAAGAGRAMVDVQGQGAGLQGTAGSLLLDQATGKGPSVAALQLKSTLAEIGNRQMSAAAGARGSSIGAARRRASREMSLQQGNAAAAGAQLRAGEMMQARGALAGLATDARGQDIGIASTQAGLDSQRNLTNASLETQTSNSNAGLATNVAVSNAGATNQGRLSQAQLEQDARQQAAARTAARAAQQAGLTTQVSTVNAGIDANRASQQAGLDTGVNTTNAGAVNTSREAAATRQTGISATNAAAANANAENNTGRQQQTGLANQDASNVVAGNNEDRRTNERSGVRNAAVGLNTTVTDIEKQKLAAGEAGKDRTVNLLKGAADTAAAAGKMSDRRAKKDVEPARNAAVESFLDSFDGKTWNYKNPDMPETGPGRQSGAMAQDLDNTPMGREFVDNTPKGKMLDPADALGPVLASLSYLNKKIDAVTKTRRAAAREMA